VRFGFVSSFQAEAATLSFGMKNFDGDHLHVPDIRNSRIPTFQPADTKIKSASILHPVD